MTDISEYLKIHPKQRLVNSSYRVEFTHSLEETNMALQWVQNEHHPKGKWRVSQLDDGQLCCYFGESFDEALKYLQTDKRLLRRKLYDEY